MKKIPILLFMCMLLIYCNNLYAATPLAPVPEGGNLISGKETNKEIYIYNNTTLAEIDKFYKNTFKDYPGLSRQKAESPKVISMNDWGNSKWHNITITDKDKDGIEIVITRDSWTWIIGTLVIRFVGVFIILATLMIFMFISSYFFTRYDSKKKTVAQLG